MISLENNVRYECQDTRLNQKATWHVPSLSWGLGVLGNFDELPL